MLSRLPRQPSDERLLVGYDTADDGGVFLVREDLAIVQTVDFFTPIVDDPYVYGRIAALNSLNDVWAMGGEAITALSVAAFPRKGVPMEILGEIMRGGLDVLIENRVALLGGHTVDDPEIKFGYAVTGTIHPDEIVRNAGARPGDVLVLTKPIGTGIISTAIKFERAPSSAVDAALDTMLRSSREASRILREHGARGGTDITGFGLLGHAFEMAVASRVRLVLSAGAVPILPEALRLAGEGNLTRGDRTNREYVEGAMHLAEGLDPNLVRVLFDPQTAGGLLFSLPSDRVGDCLDRLHDAGYEAAVLVGHCEASPEGHVAVVE